MWVVSTTGFYSVVVHRDDPWRVIVRARLRGDLEALCESFASVGIKSAPTESEILDTREHDYPYRLLMSRELWREFLVREVDQMDYPSFSTALAERHGAERARITKGAWGPPRELEHLAWA